jgi:hypothetical protein
MYSLRQIFVQNRQLYGKKILSAGYTPSQSAALPSLTDFRADSSKLMLKFAVVSVLFNPRIDVFVAWA